MAGEPISQREYMRKLVNELGAEKNKVCAAYAKAELDGIVPRKRNANGTSPENYAVALWKDGLRRGWLKGE